MVPTTLRDGGVPLVDILVVAGFCATKSEGRRLIRQGAVEVDGLPVEDERAVFLLDESVWVRWKDHADRAIRLDGVRTEACGDG